MKHKIFLFLSFVILQPCWGSNFPIKLESTEFIPVITLSEFIGAPTPTPTKSDVAPVIYTNTDDTHWIKKEIQDSSGRIRSISCTGQYCTGVGDIQDFHSTTTSGGSESTTTLMSYSSYDGGINWIPNNLGRYGITSGLNGVACNADQHCVAVGGITPIGKSPGAMRPVVYTSFDSGNSWVPNYPESLDTSNGSALHAITCFGENSQFCIALGDFNPLKTTTKTFVSYISTDGGLNWTHYIIGDLRIDSSLRAISCNNGGEYCIAVGDLRVNGQMQPLIYETKNAGKNWERVPFATSSDASLEGIACFSNSCIAVGYENNQPIILKNSNNGKDWVKSKVWSKLTPNPNVRCSNHACAFLIKGINVDLKYDEFFFTSSRLNSIVCAKDGIACIAIGYDLYRITLQNKDTIHVLVPVIYKSTDSGRNWYVVLEPVTYKFNDPEDIWSVQRNALISDFGYMPAIESVGINIASINFQ